MYCFAFYLIAWLFVVYYCYCFIVFYLCCILMFYISLKWWAPCMGPTPRSCLILSILAFYLCCMFQICRTHNKIVAKNDRTIGQLSLDGGEIQLWTCAASTSCIELWNWANSVLPHCIDQQLRTLCNCFQFHLISRGILLSLSFIWCSVPTIPNEIRSAW